VRWLFFALRLAASANAAVASFSPQVSGKRGKRFLHLNRALAALAAE
jgi:hypothetical protein